MGKERRFSKGIELRSQGDGKLPLIVGYAIRFNEFSDPNYARSVGYWERIMPEAPVQALGNPGRDIRAVRNHDSNWVLGRNCPSKNVYTCNWTIDEKGVLVTIDPPDTQQARDLLVNIERRDVDGMSFGFWVSDAKWDEEHDGLPVRDIKNMRDLDDFTIATYPVYPSTSAELRAIVGDIPEIPSHIKEKRDLIKSPLAVLELEQKFREKRLTNLERI